jgi:hypothetical protein
MYGGSPAEIQLLRKDTSFVRPSADANTEAGISRPTVNCGHRTKITFAVWHRTTGHQAVKDEEICIEWHDGQPTARDNIRLCISFEQMFERPPTSGTAEGDLIFSEQELSSIACSIWQDMDLISRG